MRKILFLIIALVSIKSAFARPISYSGGTTLMLMNDAMKNSIHLHYSPSYKYSVGYVGQNYRMQEVTTNGVQLNRLVKRWNQKESQGNIYLKSSFGQANHSSKDDIYGFTSIAGDFETRRYFISYENRFTKSTRNIINQFEQSARVGVAPYLENYGNIHTWLMLEVSHQPKFKGDKIITTPLIRLFKGTDLVEFGVSSNSRVLFNYIKRF